MIKCNKCSEVKPITEYRKPSINKCGTKGICKSCKKEFDRKNWAKLSKDPEFRARHEANQYKYKEKKRIYQKKYDAENLDKKYASQYRRYHEDINVRIRRMVSLRIWSALQSRNESKKYKAEEYLGCKIKEYVKYLENQFDDKMNWDNYGSYWEIDHIKQICDGGSFHYTNTRPLSVTENRRRPKKNKNGKR